MSEQPESTQHVRDAYIEGQVHDCYYEGDVKTTPDGVLAGEDFDAWLADEKARALEEAAAEMRLQGFGASVGHLRARAAGMREGRTNERSN